MVGEHRTSTWRKNIVHQHTITHPGLGKNNVTHRKVITYIVSSHHKVKASARHCSYGRVVVIGCRM